MEVKFTLAARAVPAVIIGLVCVGCQTKSVDTPQLVYAPDAPMWNLSRTGFIEEMVFPQATERTPHFNDYSKGSYRVHKGDLIEAVASFRQEKGIPVLAVMAMGPVGELQQYHVVTVLEHADRPGSVVVNEILFSHARIAAKFTSTRARGDVDALLDYMTETPLLRNGYPPMHLLYPEQSDVSVHFAVADWRLPESSIRHGEPATLEGEAPEVDAFWEAVGTLLDGMTLTYSTYLPREYLYPKGGGEE